MQAVHFFYEDIDFRLNHPDNTIQWVQKIIENEGYQAQELNFIFCTDEYLHKINLQYLEHDTYTDIITFDNSDAPQVIEGDIFISVERVQDNAHSMQINFETELHRVIIHGVLHLLGHADKSDKEKLAMREKEEACLSLRFE